MKKLLFYGKQAEYRDRYYKHSPSLDRKGSGLLC